MKIITSLMVLAFMLCIQPSIAQEIIYSDNDTFYAIDILTKKTQEQSLTKAIETPTKSIPLDRIAFSTSEISKDFEVSQDFDFFQGLQSPYDPQLWIYTERAQIGGAFALKSTHLKQNTTSLLIQKANKNHEDLAYKPIGWSKHPDIIYVEALYLDAAEEHEGIFTLHIKTGKLTQLDIPFAYLTTPLLSPDRSRFIFSGVQNQKLDYLHGQADVIYDYTIASAASKVLLTSEKGQLYIHGWKKQILSKSTISPAIEKSSLSYYLPWDFGAENCVSRHGTPGPTLSHSPVGKCNWFTPGGHHGYSAIDFATSLSSDDNVRASAAGTVSFSGISGSLSSGYGRLVILRHSDGTRTYYAHNKVLLVNQGQTVQKGQIIAKEGTTGGSTGDHIHFEWRAAGGNASTPGSFVDAGQPRQNYIYRSQNTYGSSADTQAPTTTISASGGTTQAGDFTANFNDSDNIGVTRRFYQALEKYGDNWYANRNNGFFNDNFNVFYGGYTLGAGNWSINSGRLRQSNTSSDNTKLSSYVSQNSGLPYLYEFAAKVESTSGPRKFGIHIMADDATLDQRGNSYLIWFSGEDNKVRIYETVNNVLNFRAIGDAPQDNQWGNYKITYSPAYGVIEVFKNNVSVLKWTDSSPITNGSSISLRTNTTVVEFDDLKVYKFRAGNSQTITAGTAGTKDIRRRNGKIKSLVRDAAGNWSSPGNLDITISSLTKQNITDDTQLEPESILLYPNPTNGDVLLLQFPTEIEGDVKISLLDYTGKILKTKKETATATSKYKTDLSDFVKDLASGIYFVSFRNHAHSQSIKLLIER